MSTNRKRRHDDLPAKSDGALERSEAGGELDEQGGSAVGGYRIDDEGIEISIDFDLSWPPSGHIDVVKHKKTVEPVERRTVTCSACGELGHNRRGCPDVIDLND